MKSLWTFVATVAVLFAAQTGAVAQAPRPDPEKDAYFAAENERFAERSKPAKEMLKKAYAYRNAGDLKRAEETWLEVMRMGYAWGEGRLMLVKLYLASAATRMRSRCASCTWMSLPTTRRTLTTSSAFACSGQDGARRPGSCTRGLS